MNNHEFRIESSDGRKLTKEELEKLPCRGTGYCPACEAFECSMNRNYEYYYNDNCDDEYYY